MSTLYEIDTAIMNCIDTETGEIIDIDALGALQMEREQKLEGVALWVKNLTADAAAYKAEKEAFAERERRAAAKAESLKRFLAYALNGEKFTTTRCAVSFRRSKAVEISDEAALPAEFKTEAITYKPDKKAIKAAIEAGQSVAGCELVERLNASVK